MRHSLKATIEGLTVAKKKPEPTPAPTPKSKPQKGQMRANVRVPSEFMAMGEIIAEHYGLESVTGAIRFLFLREYRAIMPAQALKPKGDGES